VKSGLLLGALQGSVLQSWQKGFIAV
jgi:hypothetical protein